MILTEAQILAIQDVRFAFPTQPVVLIGAAALALHYADQGLRRTNDLDLTLLCEDFQIDHVGEQLVTFRQDPKIVHRFHHKATGLQVDLLAVGPTALSKGERIFSETGSIMNVTGFDLALDSSISHEVVFGILVALPSVVVLLKMAAFLDRPGERERDLEDIAFVLQHYLPEDDLRRFEAPLTESGLTFELQSAYALAHDLKALVTDVHRQLVSGFLAHLKGSHGQYFAIMARHVFPGPEDRSETLEQLLDAFICGFNAG